MQEASTSVVSRKRDRIGRIFQWLVAGFFLLLTLVLLIDLPKLSIRGAPVFLFFSTFVMVALTAVFLSPPVFFRLPLKGRFASYAFILAVFIVFGTYAGKMSAAYDRTPEGMAAAEKERAEVIAQATAAAARAEAAVAAINSGEGEIDPNAGGDHSCAALVSDVIDMSKDKGLEIFEINGLTAIYQSGDTTSCSGVAITEKGEGSIHFGTQVTPQGNEILTSSFPHGLR